MRLLLLVAIIVILPFTCAFAEDINLISNPGFEEGSGNDPYFWINQAWEKKQGVTEFILDSNNRHSGDKSGCIINSLPNDARYKQEIKVSGSSFYKISCWIKTDNVGEGSKGANISVDGLLDTSEDIRGTSGTWRYVELYGKTRENQGSFTLTLGLGGYGSLNTGKAWFDDVSVIELSSLPQGKTAVNLYGESSPGSTAGSSNTPWMILVILSIVLTAFLIFFAMKTQNTGKNPSYAFSKAVPSSGELKNRGAKPDKRDFVIMLSMTLIYLIVALINLGSFKVPQTGWRPANSGESFTIDLGSEKALSRVYYYLGLTERQYEGSRYRVEYADASGRFQPLSTVETNDFYKWKYINVSVKAKYLKFIADSPGGVINELGIFEKSSSKPLGNFRILDKKTSSIDSGSVENLFDEQKTIEYSPSYLTSTYFDEIYHARTAYEYLHRIEPYENTHPPLGKVFISLGIAIFGMNAFGWRIIGTLFGTAMIPVMYLFGKKLFHKRIYAFCTAFLMMFDFMHFVQTRIATIDVYGTFFVILMYYFMYDYYNSKSYVLGFKSSLKPLFLSGLFLGIGAACKWIGLYAGGGLALLFILAKFNEYQDYRKLSCGNPSRNEGWTKYFVSDYIIKTSLYCVLFFILIPAAIYLLSYIPFMLVPGPGHDLNGVLRNQYDMYNYHSTLQATHPFSSLWWEWPVMYKPIWFYTGSDLPEGYVSSIVSMGNPAVWWTGIISVLAVSIMAIKHFKYKKPLFPAISLSLLAVVFGSTAVRNFGVYLLAVCILIVVISFDKKLTIPFAAMAFQYLPWVSITRLAFIYHFFSTVPFIIISIVYMMKILLEKYSELRYTIYVYLGMVALLFIWFYPVLSGMEVPSAYVEHLKWFKSWIF